nr:protein trichome birefringence-like 26 [Tanacetum cinerariifolium]
MFALAVVDLIKRRYFFDALGSPDYDIFTGEWASDLTGPWNKSMVFIGDTISRNQVQLLFCILSQVEEPVKVYHDEECSTQIFAWFVRELEMIRVEMVTYHLRLASHALHKLITGSFLNCINGLKGSHRGTSDGSFRKKSQTLPISSSNKQSQTASI